MASPSHADLVAVAVRYLVREHRCVAVITEPTGAWAKPGEERPDAVGWTYDGHCVVVECKASRSDFLRDAKKACRTGEGLGHRRYYLVADGVCTPDEVPDGWGLRRSDGRRVLLGAGKSAPARRVHDDDLSQRILIHLVRRATGHRPLALVEQIEAERAAAREKARIWKATEDPRTEEHAAFKEWLSEPREMSFPEWMRLRALTIPSASRV